MDPTPKFEPLVPASASVREVTWNAVILGSLIAVVFGVANAYLGLKFGMTVSASIPAAVISMALLPLFSKKTTVLENNIVQTIGSSGESLAAGIIFTIPAFLIWSASQDLLARGYAYEVSKFHIFWMAMLGGSLGILSMIPLRKYLIEKEHGKLAFPEGTACAQILIAGDTGGLRAKIVFGGIALGAFYKAGYNLCKGWAESVTYSFTGVMRGGQVGLDATPALMGVGFIVGPRVSSYMFSGAVIGYLGFAPLLSYIGSQAPGVIIAPADLPLDQLNPAQIRNFYIKYLGVGAVAVGGFLSLMRAAPVIWTSVREGIREIFAGKSGPARSRTDRDVSMKWVLLGITGIAIAIWLMPGTSLHFLGSVLSVLFGFFFIVVAARIAGLVGTSSSPVSGMTIATILVTCLILLYFGVSGVQGMVTAMSVGTIVCIAVCMSGDIAQDLKTGYLVGATPWKQQLVEFIGLLFPAIAMGFTIYFLNEAFGFVQGASGRAPLLAPQANVMATLVDGVMNGHLPWAPILVGGMIALAVQFLGVPALPVAIGMYLPLTLSAPIMCGAIVAWLVGKLAKPAEAEGRNLRGVLLASGIVAGDALVGVFVALLIGIWPRYAEYYDRHEGMMNSLTGSFGPWLSLLAFAGVMVILALVSLKGRLEKE